MLTLRRNPDSKPWWILGALMLPVLALPFGGNGAGGGVLLLMMMLHLLEIPAVLRLAEGRPVRIFVMSLVLMVPAVIGDIATAMHIVADSSARLTASSASPKCGMGSLIVFALPLMSAVAHIIGGVVLALLASAAQAVLRTPDHA